MVDGSIIINTRIDNSEIEKDLKDLNNLIESGGLDDKMAVQVEKLASQWKKYTYEVGKNAEKQAQLKASIQDNADIMQDYNNIIASGNTEATQLRESITLRKQKIATLREEMSLAKTGGERAPLAKAISGEQKLMGPEQAQYDAITAKIREAREATKEVDVEAQKLAGQYERAGLEAERLKNNLNNVAVKTTDLKAKTTANVDATNTLATTNDKVNASLRQSSMLAGMTNNNFKSAIGTVAKYAGYLIGIRSIYSGLRKAMNAWLQETEAGAQAQANLSAIWSSIGQALAPVFQWLISLLQTIMGYLNAITQILFGVTLFGNKVAKSTKSTAGGYGEAVKQAKKLNKEMKKLAGFDEMNVLNADKTTDSGGGGGGGGGGGMGAIAPMAIPTPDMSKFKEAVDTMKQWLNDIWNSDTMLSFFDSFKRIGTVYFDSIKDIYSNLWTNVVGVWNEIFPNIQEGIGNFVEYYRLVFEDLATFAETWFPTFAGNMNTFVDNVFKTFRPLFKFFSELWRDVTGIMVEIWEKYGMPILDEFGRFWDTTQQLFNQIWTKIIDPILRPALEAFSTLWNDHIKVVVKDFASFIAELVLGTLKIYNEVIAPIISYLVDKLAPVFEWIGATIIPILSDAIGTAVDMVGTIINTLRGIFSGLVTFITGVFTGNWSKAWGGVVNIFKSVFGGIKDFFKAPMNFIIRQINTVFRAFNKLKVPSWVPLIGGRGFNFTPIPQLARGGYATKASTVTIGEAGREVAVPLENNTEWAGQFLDVLDNRGGFNSGSGQVVNVVNLDGHEIAKYITQLQKEQEFATNGAVAYGN